MTNDEMRVATGDIKDHRPEVQFLYILMRDYLTPGKVEKIMASVESVQWPPISYTNGHLALYARLIAERIKDAWP